MFQMMLPISIHCARYIDAKKELDQSFFNRKHSGDFSNASEFKTDP